MGFVKMRRTPDILELLEASPLAFALAAVIALRANWKTAPNLKGLQPGEAFIGDHAAYGMSRQQYRTAMHFLERHGFATFKSTTKGTRAKLMDTRLFDVLNESAQPSKQPAANHQPTNGQPLTRSLRRKEIKKDLKTAGVRQPRCSKPTLGEVMSHAETTGVGTDVAHRFIRFNNGRGWAVRNWRKAFDAFASTCQGASGVTELPANWSPCIK